MPILDIPDSLEFTARDAYAALERELDRQQQDTRRQIVSVLQDAALAFAKRDVVPDEAVAETVATLRQALGDLRATLVRVGRVEAEMKARKEAA